jgi:hypothetical protein
MPRTRLAALALAATTVAVAGCGGSTKSSSQTTASSGTPPESVSHTDSVAQSKAPTKQLTRAELIARGDEICARVNARRNAITIRTPADVALLVPLAAYERTAFDELGNLTPPASMAADWKIIVATAQALAEDTGKAGETAGKTNAQAAAHGPLMAFRQAQQLLSVTAARAGFKDCAEIT